MAGILSMILAGGAGTRLFPLTETRTKPAVPFAGQYRLVDFVLNNFVNSDLLKIYVLTQFKSQSLNIHLRQAWHFSGLTDHFIDPIPAQMRMGKRWYEGTADAIYQNLRLIEIHDPDLVVIFGSDHIYKMNVRQMTDFHKNKQADLTVAAIRVPIEEAHQFGVMEIDEEGRLIGFEEKPAKPKSLPGNPDVALISMGNYTFDPDVLYRVLKEDAQDPNSSHDFGKNIIPNLMAEGNVYVYDFANNHIPGERGDPFYWRDVGTIDSYWQASMDLLDSDSALDLYNPKWPMRTYHPTVPAAQIYSCSKGEANQITDSSIASGCIVEGATVKKSVLGFEVIVQPNVAITESVIMGSNVIGEGCTIHRAILDKNVEVAPGTTIGVDHDLDEKRGFTISAGGIVTVPKGTKVGFDD
ncbi:glucose-1-phosphate adenylyltransferase [Catenovulum agarivorans DS-2]|uniref:Glucose-1-phosphate adenylyltransferase n=1 Tax=Catenovulum agarivorans DS-2 TaxID=1328313 RepID=W7QAZ9_9ALTE|nr:glucose-1-phosphate adenylyltransferase [Catenovulum agarivorans]EWH10024.1 glucose-1-phosphate adenylyltransferase [Catenovulum agarivorans DS-2]